MKTYTACELEQIKLSIPLQFCFSFQLQLPNNIHFEFNNLHVHLWVDIIHRRRWEENVLFPTSWAELGGPSSPLKFFENPCLLGEICPLFYIEANFYINRACAIYKEKWQLSEIPFCPLWYETTLEYLLSQHRSLNPNFKITRTVKFPILISIRPIIKMRCLKSQNKRGVFGNPYVDLKKYLLSLNLQIHNFCKFEESRVGDEGC